MKKYRAVGVMSGTSLDGVDLAFVEFQESEESKWSFVLLENESIPYTKDWQNRLLQLPKASALEYVKTHIAYGKYTGALVDDFLKRNALTPDVIAVHGHTIFHHPQQSYTSQIGDGASIAAATGHIVACDFRSMDVARGGQGAPLVPIGDQLLFGDYEARLNIGGFANISYEVDNELIAYDIGPANIILNTVTRKLGKDFDDKGMLAREGVLHTRLLEKLHSLPFYKKKYPKSLGKEWVDENTAIFFPSDILPQDLLHTLVEHISIVIANELNLLPEGKVFITGGGAFNDYLIERIQEKSALKIVIPERSIIEMKEAIIFAFLGVLRMLNRSNILHQVTGACSASISGALYDGRIVL